MKKIYFFCFCTLLSGAIHAQVNLPHVLTFSEDDAAAWSDGIAQDGDGGSSDINGLDLQIFTADASFNLLAGSTIRWDDNNYYSSSDANYHAITSGPDVYVTNNGAPAMVMRNSNPAVNFSLQSIELYDWGGYTPVIISTYDNGALVGTVEVEFDMVDYLPKTISVNDELTPSFFNNIDEIRFYPKSPETVFNLSMNNISLGTPSALPVRMDYFKGKLDKNKNWVLEWATSMEQNSSHFDIESSATGTDFKKVGRVAAQGNSSVKNLYSFMYPSSNDEVQFFRLRQVDMDGKETFSQVIILRKAAAVSLKAGPNPTANWVLLESDLGDIQNVSVFNAAGERCLSFGDIGSNSYQVNLSSLPAGVYYLHARIGDHLEKMTIVKQ